MVALLRRNLTPRALRLAPRCFEPTAIICADAPRWKMGRRTFVLSDHGSAVTCGSVPLLPMSKRVRTRELPGTTEPRRFIPRFHYELLVCGVRGHELVGTEAAEVRAEDAAVVRPGAEGERWHRCLRCDSWLPLSAPARPVRRYPPSREEVELPLRGRPLRD